MTLLVEWAGGLFVSDLVERLTEYYNEDGREIVLRPLLLRPGQRAEKESALEEFVREMFMNSRGANTIVPVAEILSATRKQVLFVNDRSDKEDNLDVLFCSKTVAACYKHIGLIPARRRAADILPKHFSSEHDRFLGLQQGARLGPEVGVSFETALLRPIVLAFFSITATSKQARERRAAIIIERQFRKHHAQMEAERRRIERDPMRRVVARCSQCLAACLPPAISPHSPTHVERHVVSRINQGGSSELLVRELSEHITHGAPRAPPMPRLTLGARVEHWREPR